MSEAIANTQTALGQSLLKSMIELRESKGKLLIEDVAGILDGMAGSLKSASAEDTFLKDEIEKMASYIVEARHEIESMVPGEDKEAPENMQLASEELLAVVKHTEEATNTIMDAADEIQNAASEITDAALAEKIMNATMTIYDACNFQDITGQRINKVIRLLGNIEARVVRLVLLFGGALPEGYEAPPQLVEDMRKDADLMEGPQLDKDRPSQDDIDALFDSIE